MALGDGLQKRMEELAKRQAMIPKRLAAISEGATLRAVEAAQDRTPPNDGKLRGVHTITGELSEHWATDSQTVPVQTGSQFATTLANDKDYASYVNDGHRMDKHFVRGLFVDDSGLLSMDLTADTGMMVGTKTKFVPGLYMKEAGIDKFKEVSEAELQKLPGEVFR